MCSASPSRAVTRPPPPRVCSLHRPSAWPNVTGPRLDTRIRGGGRLLTDHAPVGQDVRRARLYAPRTPAAADGVLNVRLYRTVVAGGRRRPRGGAAHPADPGRGPGAAAAVDHRRPGHAPAGQAARVDRAPAPAGLGARPPGGALRAGPARAGARGGGARQPEEPRPGAGLPGARDGEPVDLQNVYLVVPGVADGERAGRHPRGRAARHARRACRPGASSTAVLLRLAQASGTTRHQRPHLFVSTDGSTIGNAGLRWFLKRFSAFPLSAVIVLDAPGRGQRRPDPRLDRRAHRPRSRSGSATSPTARWSGSAGGPTARRRWAASSCASAVPQTFGEQGAAIAAGLPAVTLSGRSESPLREGRRRRRSASSWSPTRPTTSSGPWTGRRQHPRGRRQPALRGQVPAAHHRAPRAPARDAAGAGRAARHRRPPAPGPRAAGRRPARGRPAGGPARRPPSASPTCSRSAGCCPGRPPGRLRSPPTPASAPSPASRSSSRSRRGTSAGASPAARARRIGASPAVRGHGGARRPSRSCCSSSGVLSPYALVLAMPGGPRGPARHRRAPPVAPARARRPRAAAARAGDGALLAGSSTPTPSSRSGT